MKHLKVYGFLFFGACLAVLVLFVSAQVEQVNIKREYEYDFYWTPSESDCLTETIHLFGTYEEHFHWVQRKNGTYHFQVIQTVRGLTAVGLTSGITYHYSGPLSYTENGEGDGVEIYYPFEWTFHNINHFVGPGPLPNVCFRTLSHGKYNWETGQLEVKFVKDDVRCH
jgi:hypothetical protein